MSAPNVINLITEWPEPFIPVPPRLVYHLSGDLKSNFSATSANQQATTESHYLDPWQRGCEGKARESMGTQGKAWKAKARKARERDSKGQQESKGKQVKARNKETARESKAKQGKGKQQSDGRQVACRFGLGLGTLKNGEKQTQDDSHVCITLHKNVRQVHSIHGVYIPSACIMHLGCIVGLGTLTKNRQKGMHVGLGTFMQQRCTNMRDVLRAVCRVCEVCMHVVRISCAFYNMQTKGIQSHAPCGKKHLSHVRAGL